jgi:hypothetical protein
MFYSTLKSALAYYNAGVVAVNLKAVGFFPDSECDKTNRPSQLVFLHAKANAGTLNGTLDLIDLATWQSGHRFRLRIRKLLVQIPSRV